MTDTQPTVASWKTIAEDAQKERDQALIDVRRLREEIAEAHERIRHLLDTYTK